MGIWSLSCEMMLPSCRSGHTDSQNFFVLFVSRDGKSCEKYLSRAARTLEQYLFKKSVYFFQDIGVDARFADAYNRFFLFLSWLSDLVNHGLRL